MKLNGVGKLSLRILRIPVGETSFERRAFYDGDPNVRECLESVGRAFVNGYHESLLDVDPETLARRLNRIEPDRRGFAFEGAAMGLTLLDHLTPWNGGRLERFLAGPGAIHTYMIHVGVGWAIGRIPWLRRRVDAFLERLNPLLRWLAIDGYGFHEGYFHWPRYVAEQEKPRSLSGYGCRVFDQGLGRSLWFVDGADVGRIRVTIAAFDLCRQPDLWSGVGLACAYAGGVDAAAIEALRAAAGPYRSELAQGAAFAAKARLHAGNTTEHTDLACRIFCGVSADAASRVTDEALEQLSPNGVEPSYAVWRRKIQTKFTMEMLV